jgi:CheY-like chemotaxis protein
MNVSTGGSHILLFERDQQLAALLSSELQLAGYECHTARTAVEVFDAIARHQVRLVLVNLAQAAAGRREFWVALDAQRRGRGVLVLTYRCTNLASYGSYDPEEHPQAADVEVDGMMGIMRLVEAVRAQVPLPTTASHPQVHLADLPTVMQASPSPLSPGASMAPMASSQQPTLPQPAVFPSGPLPASQLSFSPASPAHGSGGGAQSAAAPAPAAPPIHSFTDKIRAVIYPGSRSFSPAVAHEGAWSNQPGGLAGAQFAGSTGGLPGSDGPTMMLSSQAGVQGFGPPQASAATQGPGPGMAPRQAAASHQAAAPMQASPLFSQPVADEVSSHVPPAQLPAAQQGGYRQNAQAYTQYAPPAEKAESSLAQLTRLLRERAAPAPEPPTATAEPAQRSPQPELSPLSSASLRPAPIQGLHSDQESDYRPPRFEQHPLMRSQIGMAPAPGELSSLRMAASAATRAPEGAAQSSSLQSAAAAAAGESLATERRGEPLAEPERRSREHAEEETAKEVIYPDPIPSRPEPRESRESVTSDTTLLDIVQSLPPMESPPSPPPVLNGRATRSLGSVLLEGHLVPPDRLEVAQNVQRMLRGVDLNYQLGEILLMFKLLTPDQLLAASLVSYGLLNTAQIRSLGRIRQELHAMGLEYDLENLLILFRILTPEQLREVRASWSS